MYQETLTEHFERFKKNFEAALRWLYEDYQNRRGATVCARCFEATTSVRNTGRVLYVGATFNAIDFSFGAQEVF